jgi:hypothetical protein
MEIPKIIYKVEYDRISTSEYSFVNEKVLHQTYEDEFYGHLHEVVNIIEEEKFGREVITVIFDDEQEEKILNISRVLKMRSNEQKEKGNN